MAYATVEAAGMNEDQTAVLALLLDAINSVSGSEGDAGVDNSKTTEETKKATTQAGTSTQQ